MRKQKFFICAAALCLSVTLASCGGGGGDDTKKEVAILVPSADHGWTGAVGGYADEYAKEMNEKADSKYTYKVYRAETNEVQLGTIDTLIAGGKTAGVAILPMSNDTESGIVKLANSDIPFTMVDRIISNATIDGSKSLVSTVKGDNEGIGKQTAIKFKALGIEKGDKVLVMPGDNSSVPTSRNKGFTDQMMTYGWTQADLDASLKSTDFTNWNRSNSRTLFQNWIDAENDVAAYKFVFTHDSEISLGILEELADNKIADAKKAAFKANIKAIGSSSGLEEMYQVIRGDHPRSSTYNSLVNADCVLFDVTYPPEMIKDGAQDVTDFLNGKTVSKSHVIPCEVIDKNSIGDKVGFGGKVK